MERLESLEVNRSLYVNSSACYAGYITSCKAVSDILDNFEKF